MRYIVRILYGFIFLFTLALSLNSCNEDELLDETPLDFASPRTSFVTIDDFNSAIYALYSTAQTVLSGGEHRPMDYLYGTDLGYNGATQLNARFGSYLAYLTPQNGNISYHWNQYYRLISSSNIVLGRLEASELTQEQKTFVEANARLFRGLAYRNLTYLYGGVPIELEEVASPKTDYVRATREESYQQAIEDLEFAVANLPEISEVIDGEVSNAAANHLLADVYIATERWQDAIDATTEVIENPNIALMTERFGSRSDNPGDVFWDLFRQGNQNRASGNTEGIWVWQQELDVPGGRLSSSSRDRLSAQLERDVAPRPWSFPYTDPEGINPFLPLGVSDYTGGRGIGRFRLTNYYAYSIWSGTNGDDMRNSEFNFIRDVPFNNPESVWFGQNLSDHRDIFRQTTIDTIRYFYPYPSKVTTPGNHPPELFVDADLMTLNAGAAGSTYTDQYFIRLPETYLLRAEAHLGAGNAAAAADDINVLRDRADAVPVTAGEVDIEYILDERARELGVEEKRRFTLQRLGLLHERVSRLTEGNPASSNFGLDVQPYHNLWPIPFSEIENNTGAVLEQNPGY